MCIILVGILVFLSISVSCTKQEERQSEQETEALQAIHVLRTGDVTLNGRPVEIDTLADALSELTHVLITADGKAETQGLINVAGECRKAGVKNAWIDWGGKPVPVDFNRNDGKSKLIVK